jgi:hypothetical protein
VRTGDGGAFPAASQEAWQPMHTVCTDLGTSSTAQQSAQLHGWRQEAGTVQSDVANRPRLAIRSCQRVSRHLWRKLSGTLRAGTLAHRTPPQRTLHCAAATLRQAQLPLLGGHHQPVALPMHAACRRSLAAGRSLARLPVRLQMADPQPAALQCVPLVLPLSCQLAGVWRQPHARSQLAATYSNSTD